MSSLLKELPSISTLLSIYASVSAMVMLIRTIFNEMDYLLQSGHLHKSYLLSKSQSRVSIRQFLSPKAVPKEFGPHPRIQRYVIKFISLPGGLCSPWPRLVQQHSEHSRVSSRKRSRNLSR
ncbi:hypothetical protein QQP08_026341 [Theobroma cacao]|nr:hypothetical protein QQP08_026341 [Theobroma cacao]